MYLITTSGHGRGGHFYSLRTISEAIKAYTDIIIVNIGVRMSPVIEDAGLKSFHLNFNGKNIFQVVKKIQRIINSENPTILHPFDIKALAIARIASYWNKIPLVFTKCGGPNPQKYFPFVDNLILFSKENFDYFKKDLKFKKSTLYYLPNRIKHIEDDNENIKEIKNLTKDRVVFMQIARIGLAYEGSILQSLTLIEKLVKDGFKVVLVLIGTIESFEVLNRLKSVNGFESTIFFNDDRFTINASKNLNAADFVIGTGRGLMEAASKGKVLLTPMKRAVFPVLVDKKTADSFLYTNFSPRNYIKDFNENENYNQIQCLIKDKKEYLMYQRFVKKMFREHFDLKAIESRYMNLYATIEYNPSYHFFDFFRNIASVVYHQYLAARENTFSFRK